MATHVVRMSILWRTGVVLKTKQIFIFIECAMGYHTSKTSIPHQTPSPLHFMTSFQSKKHWNCVLTRTKSSGMNTVLDKNNMPIFRQPPQDTSNLFHWNTATQTTSYSNPHHIRFFTTLKTWSKELGDIRDKDVDGARWDNWMTSTTLFSLTTQYLMLQCFAPLLCYSLFYLPKRNKERNCPSGDCSRHIQKGMQH